MRLESKIRKLSVEYGPVYVVTGVLYESSMPTLPNKSDAKVPSGYWKVFSVKKTETWVVSAFILPQSALRRSDICEYYTSIDKLEERLGYKVVRKQKNKKYLASAKLVC